MDGPGGRDPRFNVGYGLGMGGLESSPEMYGNPSLARPPSQQGRNIQNCGMSRGIKRPGSDSMYDDRSMGSQGLGLEHCQMPEVVDDGYTSMQPKKSPPSNGKKTKGRVKIKMEYIDNKLRRYTTFSKRKTGIMKKAYELSTLTGTQVMLLVASETGHVYTFATRKLQPMITSDSGKRLIQTCLNSPDPPSGAPVGDQRMSAAGFEETELTYSVVDEDVKRENSDDSSAESCDDSGSEPESPAPEPSRIHSAKQYYRDSASDNENGRDQTREPTPSTSGEESSSKPLNLQTGNQNLAAMGFNPSMLSNLEGMGANFMGYPHGILVGLPQGQSGEGASTSQPQYITIPLSMAMAAANQQQSTETGLQDLSNKSSRK